MPSESRRKPRRAFFHAAWLHLGEGLPRRKCAVADISDSGARLDVAAPQDLPDHFVLMLSASGSARRLCRMVWRSPNQIGVQFVTPEVFGSLTERPSSPSRPQPAA
jgi:hypothetical protein